jgi:2-deoxy-D-gluconate 3-dehydrogenase
MTLKTIAQLFDLSGKGAVVTGGAMGIGQGIAFRLAEAGAGVIIADIAMKEAKDTVKQIKEKGGKAKAIHADVRRAADAKKAIQAAVAAYGSIDILVNDAGIEPGCKFMESDEASLNEIFDVNVKGVFLFSQVAAQAMIKAGHGGKIIHLASMAGLSPARGQSIYSASKASVVSLTKSMAKELAPYGILVNAVAPGGIATPGAWAAAPNIQKALDMTDEETLQTHLARVPLNRLGEPDDIGKVVLFLASEAADFVTGAVISADGGYLVT